MKIVMPIFVAAVLVAASMVPSQSAPPEDNSAEINTMVVELKKQQAAFTENQKQMDAKIVAIAEELRVAKIYSGRSK